MSSDNYSARDHELPIPTICLHSLNDSSPQSENYPTNSDSDCHSGDEQSFSRTITNFCSWLSQYGAYKKFLVSAVLCFQCEVNFFRNQPEASSLLYASHSLKLENDPAKWLDSKLAYIYSVQWGAISEEQFLIELTNFLSILTSPTSCYIHCRFQSGLSTSPSSERIQPPSTSFLEPTVSEISSNLNQLWEKFHRLKCHYVRLFTELLYHTDSWDLLFPSLMDANLTRVETPDGSLKEHICQTLIGQVLLKTMLHPIFSQDDQTWIIHTLRSHRRTFNGGDKMKTERVNHVCKLLDCFLEIALDVFSMVQTVNLGFDSMTSQCSMSPSLTSSGFLSASGGGGSGSQYDLLSEVLNTTHHSTAASHYGSLLTVPSSDVRIIPTQNHPPPYQPVQQQAFSGDCGEKRQHSDSSESFTQSTPKNHPSGVPVRPKITSNRHLSPPCMYSPDSRSLNDYRADGSTNLADDNRPIKPTLSRASFPNTLSPSMGVGVEQTGDSASLSSTSSVFSSSLDLGGPSLRRLSVSPILSTTDVMNRVSHEDASSSSPSPTSLYKRSAGLCGFAIDTQSTSLPSDMLNDNHNESNGTNPPSSSAWWNESFASQGREYSGGVTIGTDTLSRNVQSRNTPSSYNDPHSGMSAVPLWLKSLRLHKYAGLFEHLTYEEFIQTTQTWLENRHVTQGARTKLLLNLKKLSSRKDTLVQLEDVLLQTPLFSSNAVFAIHDCLSAIWDMFQTPFKPCPTVLSHCSPQFHATLEDQPITGTLPNLNLLNNISCSLSSRHTTMQIHLEKGKKLIRTSTIGSCDSTVSLTSNQCLPCQMMNCLTKVCSRLLVTPQPDIECCRRFIQLLDVINTHPAFSSKHKRLVTSWRRQMFSIQDSLFRHGQPSDVQRISRSVPRFHHHRVKSSKQSYGIRSCRQPIVWKPNTHPMNQTYKSTDELHGRGHPRSTVDSTTQFPRIFLINNKSEKSLDDNGYRRHSVPVNQTANGPMPARTYSGRRMPSPNFALMTGRRNDFPVCFPEPSAIRHQAVSDLDVSHLIAPSCSHSRFSSPTGLDYTSLRPGPPRQLAPPATAPATRLPSPSDVNRHLNFYSESQSGAFRVGAFPNPNTFGASESNLTGRTNGHFSSPNAGGCVETNYGTYLPDTYDRDHLSVHSRCNYDPGRAKLRPSEPYIGSANSCEMFNSNESIIQKFNFSNQNFSPHLVQPHAAFNPVNAVTVDSAVDSKFLPYSTIPSGMYDFEYRCCEGFPLLCKTDAQWSASQEPGTDHIDHDLELLTRNVTELAIGDSDSPVGDAN